MSFSPHMSLLAETSRGRSRGKRRREGYGEHLTLPHDLSLSLLLFSQPPPSPARSFSRTPSLFGTTFLPSSLSFSRALSFPDLTATALARPIFLSSSIVISYLKVLLLSYQLSTSTSTTSCCCRRRRIPKGYLWSC
ncbi:hypothetical protein ACLOJK_029007 [Asimina triloba]